LFELDLEEPEVVVTDTCNFDKLVEIGGLPIIERSLGG